MPGFFTHHLILEESNKHISKAAKKIMDDHPVATRWGSIGPDYLYFHPDDWGELGHIYEKWEDLLEFIKPFQEALDKISPPVYDTVNDATLGALEDANDILEILLALFTTKIVPFLTNQIDLFEKFTPPLNSNIIEKSGNPDEQWWWSDIAHSKLSTDYLHEIWNYAKAHNNNELKAYCLGYACHMGADIIGHPYVNYIVGGPYRQHWRRHAYIEKCLDTYLWNIQHQDSVGSSRLQELYTFGKTGSKNRKMPRHLIKMITASMNKIYGHLDKKTFEHRHVESCYNLFTKWIGGTTDFGLLNVPEPLPFDLSQVEEVVKEKIRKIQKKIGSNPQLPKKITIETMAAFLVSVLEYSKRLLESAVEIAKVVIILNPSTWAIKYALYEIMMLLYETHKIIKLDLELQGWIHPEPSTLFKYLMHNIDPKQWIPYEGDYPYEHFTNPEQTYHIYSPMEFNNKLKTIIQTESPPSKPFYSNVDMGIVNNLMDTNVHQYRIANELYKACSTQKLPHISATTASVFMINELINNGLHGFPTYNLDGDRGFLHPMWTTQKKKNWTEQDIIRVCKP